MSKRLRIIFRVQRHLLEALEGKHGILWNASCKKTEICLLQRRYSLKVPSLINDIEESQFTLGDIQEWCFLNRLMPLIQLQEGSVTEAATVWNVLHTIPGVNKINLSCVQGCVNKPRPHLAAHSTRWFQLKPPASKENQIMLRCTLETRVSRPNTDPDIHGPELGCASAEFQEDEQARWRSRTALLFLLEAAWVQPLEILLIKPFRAS